MNRITAATTAATALAMLTSAVAAHAVPLVAPAPARHTAAAVDIGRAGLPETRTTTRLATGVTLTTIVRGQKAATPATRGTTQEGPWRIRVATIDPRRATGQLRTAIGSDIARTEGVSVLGRWSRSVVAVNGSFFSQGRATAPGDMVGLAVNAGTVISQPQRVAGHMAVLMDSRAKTIRIDDFRWAGTLTGDGGESLAVGAVNSPPAVPVGCTDPADTAACTSAGPLVRFTPHYAARTPSGPGAEVVLDRQGCVVSARPTRGSRITPAQTAFQATGTTAAELLRVAGTGCPRYTEELTDRAGARVPLRSTTFGAVGRYQLVRDGRIVAPTYTTSFFQRQPRTLIGRTSGGSIMLVTVDGRSVGSVGATIQEEARLARSLGMVEAMNLDGGGSTAMAVRGKLVNTPAGGKERSVGDAIVLMP